MKIMIIGVFGRAGGKIYQEALRRGHQVVGVAHRLHKRPQVAHLLVKDMRDLTKNDMSGLDAVIDAVGAWSPEGEAVHTDGLMHVISLLKGTKTRYLKVGAASTLYTDKNHRHQLQENPRYYPKYMQDLCLAHSLGLQLLKDSQAVVWTYVTPPYNFDPEGQASGHYAVTGDEYLPASDPSEGVDDYISYADYAKGMLDIVENHQFLGQQVTLYSGNNPKPMQRY
ncbi:NAD(P)-dependent oxidoreductase [Lacticaseibacillus suibinensis]|uniref:NAD(P)-dependent oxidoreductase n=1 Tax=Lacticaseibacillus suibinensis TaxID=2486011 RepID=UPI000F7A74BF|nr:NAD(P)H-binding protein [Lacticaseibacillus suibinensis]